MSLILDEKNCKNQDVVKMLGAIKSVHKEILKCESAGESIIDKVDMQKFRDHMDEMRVLLPDFEMPRLTFMDRCRAAYNGFMGYEETI